MRQAWELYFARHTSQFVFEPFAPILFFGDYVGYSGSKTKIITVGLNPSFREFQDLHGRPSFWRLPGIEVLRRNWNGDESQVSQYLAMLSEYFSAKPSRVHKWFISNETKIRSGGSSYYPSLNGSNIALHTDLCSPLATKFGWTDFEEEDKFTALDWEAEGSGL